MKKFIIEKNKYLNQSIKCYYNCDYIGYQQHGNPDFINKLKNMSKKYTEIDLVQDFIEVAERAQKDLKDYYKQQFVKACCVYYTSFKG